MSQHNGGDTDAPHEAHPVSSFGVGGLSHLRRRYECGCVSVLGSAADIGPPYVFTIPRHTVLRGQSPLRFPNARQKERPKK